MSDSSVYVVALFSQAHYAWCEFIVTPKADVAAGVTRQLSELAYVHTRVVKVDRDDWSLIRPALAALAAPVEDFSPKEYAMYCRELREFGAGLMDGSEPRSSAARLRAVS